MSNEIDKTSIGWFAYKAMCDQIGMGEEQAVNNWSLNNHWPHVAKIIEAEVIRRYEASISANEAKPTEQKPRYANFLEVTRDLCRST